MKITLELKTNTFFKYQFRMYPLQGEQIYLNAATKEWLTSGSGYDKSNFYVKRFHERFFARW
jgi:hypothetical protein